MIYSYDENVDLTLECQSFYEMSWNVIENPNSIKSGRIISIFCYYGSGRLRWTNVFSLLVTFNLDALLDFFYVSLCMVFSVTLLTNFNSAVLYVMIGLQVVHI